MVVAYKKFTNKEQRIKEFKAVAVDTKAIDKEFFEFLKKDTKFFTSPASTKYHGCYEGGLFDHSYFVMQALMALTNDLNLYWKNPLSPIVIGLFHDICKMDQYVESEDSKTGYGYDDQSLIKGHGIKSVVILQQHMRLTEEEIACILYHMGAFTPREEWSDYTRAIHAYPNVLWTHTADMYASHILNI